jgi:hypothetical protein
MACGCCAVSGHKARRACTEATSEKVQTPRLRRPSVRNNILSCRAPIQGRSDNAMGKLAGWQVVLLEGHAAGLRKKRSYQALDSPFARIPTLCSLCPFAWFLRKTGGILRDCVIRRLWIPPSVGRERRSRSKYAQGSAF